ncbi:MAG: zinc-dependent metalloprotease [Candidatus Nanopelagicales bacterium]
MADSVDWNLAASLGARIVGGGPQLTADEASQTVAELYYLAGEATPLVQETTGLDAYIASKVQVVDRPEWIRSNVDSFARISDPLTQRLQKGSAWTREIGSRATGAQLGLVLGFVGSRVLGQFEIFTPTIRACCWWLPISSAWSANSGRCRATSGCGCVCTSRPTASSSPPRPGSPSTCSPTSMSTCGYPT